jgi:hypothetical protein
VTVIVPALLPVKFAEHEPVSPLPPPRVQLALVGDTPAPLAVKLTVPVGVLDPDAVSVTVTVQLLAAPTRTGLVQLTDVLVERLTVIEALPELVAWMVSPP